MSGMTQEMRAGQQAFNELYATDPGLAEQIRATEFDPFYDDTLLPKFRARVNALRSGCATGSD